MAVTVYTYSVATDTGAAAVDVTALVGEIVAAFGEIGELPIGAHREEDSAGEPTDVLKITMAAAITKSTLDTVVTAHMGVPALSHRARATVAVVLDEVAITEDATWQDLGAFVATPSKLGNAANMHVEACLEVKAVNGGGAAQLRIVDDDGSELTVLQSIPYAIANNASFVIVEFQADDTAPISDVLPHNIRLEGRKNGATSASVRRANLSIMEDL